MTFECSADEQDGARVFTLKGRVDGASASDMERAIGDAFGEPGRRAVLDLAGLTYISSAGLRVVLVLAKKARQGGGRLVLCGLLPHVREVFEFSGFLKIIDVAQDRAAAMAALR